MAIRKKTGHSRGGLFKSPKRHAASSENQIPAIDWQTDGYHMEDTTAGMVPLDDSNDQGYIPPMPDPQQVPDPFDDTAVDPHLRDVRSYDLNAHEGRFWQVPAEPSSVPANEKAGTQPQQAEHQHAIEHVLDKREKQKPKGWVRRKRQPGEPKTLSPNMRILRGVGIGAAAVAVLVVLALLLIPRIQVIRVEGNSRLSEAAIIRLSGVKRGMNLWFLDDSAVEDKIEKDRYLTNVKVKKEFGLPMTLVINVRERTQVSYINYCGIIYVLDSRGMVLEESADANVRPALMRLEGLDVKSCSVGQRIALKSESQLNIYMQVMMEIKALKLTDLVVEFYVNDVNNLYIATSDGYSVRLGDSSRIHAKLRAMLLTRDELIRRECTGGTIDVSVPGAPTYIPENNA